VPHCSRKLLAARCETPDCQSSPALDQPLVGGDLQSPARTAKGALGIMRPISAGSTKRRWSGLAQAVNIALRELKRRLREIPKSHEVVTYCRGPYCVLGFEAVLCCVISDLGSGGHARTRMPFLRIISRVRRLIEHRRSGRNAKDDRPASEINRSQSKKQTTPEHPMVFHIIRRNAPVAPIRSSPAACSSYTTRLTPFTSLMMRVAARPRKFMSKG
jgi:hypothetical protein